MIDLNILHIINKISSDPSGITKVIILDNIQIINKIIHIYEI